MYEVGLSVQDEDDAKNRRKSSIIGDFSPQLYKDTNIYVYNAAVKLYDIFLCILGHKGSDEFKEFEEFKEHTITKYDLNII